MSYSPTLKKTGTQALTLPLPLSPRTALCRVFPRPGDDRRNNGLCSATATAMKGAHIATGTSNGHHHGRRRRQNSGLIERSTQYGGSAVRGMGSLCGGCTMGGGEGRRGKRRARFKKLMSSHCPLFYTIFIYLAPVPKYQRFIFLLTMSTCLTITFLYLIVIYQDPNKNQCEK